MVNRPLKAELSVSNPAPRPGGPHSDRARHAIDLALHCLRGLESTPEVRDLTQKAEDLRLEIDGWPARQPTPEMRDAAMRTALSIQVSALGILSRLRRAHLPR
jgi:hypothetical protein